MELDHNHAIVTRDGFEVPLIGIPKDATEEKCEKCGASVHLSKSVFSGSQMLCPECAKEND